jgi:hypothetical protein
MSKKRALLSADADRVQEYVLESAKLPEIRGGSFLQARLNDQEEKDKPIKELVQRLDDSVEIIYAGGGSVLAEVDAGQAEAIQSAIERLYPEKTGVATTTCVFQPVPGNVEEGYPGLLSLEAINLALKGGDEYWRWRIFTQYGYTPEDLEKEQPDELDANRYAAAHNFGEWVRLLGVRLRRRKQEKDHIPFVEAPSHAERCQSCRIRPATTLYAHYGDSIPRCAECAKKNQNSERFLWRDKFDERLREWHPQLAGEYFAVAEQGTVPRDISVIASACNPRNRNKRDYVAFIYADGDGVGSFVESRRTRDEYQKMSQDLRDAIWYAVTFALAHNLAIQTLDNPMTPDETEEQRRRPTQPFEIITVGGDDVMLIVPAHAALETTRDMAKKFNEYLEKENIRGEDRPLTLSAGVVIAPKHMPVRLMRDFARELLKKGAKPCAKEAQCAALDFQVFTSTAIYGTSVMSLRGRSPYLISHRGKQTPVLRKEDLSLLHRPYTLDEADRLLDALNALDKVDFPTSQLHGLASALERGRRWSTLYYLYQRARMGKKYRAVFDALERIVSATTRDPVPWHKLPPGADADFNTTLRDVAEFYDFVAEKGGAE